MHQKFHSHICCETNIFGGLILLIGHSLSRQGSEVGTLNRVILLYNFVLSNASIVYTACMLFSDGIEGHRRMKSKLYFRIWKINFYDLCNTVKMKLSVSLPVCLCFFWQTRFGVISKHLLFYRGLIVEQSHTCSHLLGNPLYTRMRCLRSTRVGRS